MVTRTGARRWWRRPAAISVVAMVVCVLVFAAMQRLVYRLAIDRAFIMGPAFRGWVAAAALTLIVSAVVFGLGVATIRRVEADWRPSRRWWILHAVAYVAVVVAAIAILRLYKAPQTYQVPMHGFPVVASSLIVAGAIGAAPWVLVIWLAHERVHDLNRTVEAITPPEPSDTLTASMLDGPAITSAVRESLRVWAAIERCALALAAIVSMAVLSSGALRTSLVGAGVLKDEEFPATAVLGYGAFFAAVLAMIVLPLVRAWRSVAFGLVDRAVGLPRSGVPSQEWFDIRARLEKHLRVDANILRRPITALSLLSPLLSALLTAFIPSVT